jgi:hypothetical protein
MQKQQHLRQIAVDLMWHSICLDSHNKGENGNLHRIEKDLEYLLIMSIYDLYTFFGHLHTFSSLKDV